MRGTLRRLAPVAALVVALVGPPAPTALAQRAPALPTPAPPSAEAFGPPTWLPLRHDLDGGPVTVGCTYESHGSAFGYECGGHHGRWALDFLAEAGTPVYAAGRGFATDLTGRSGGSGFGNVVQVDHGGGDTTLYAHLTEVLVPAEGAWVTPDTQLGTVGSTGSSSANHLHYERRDLTTDRSVDPGGLLACWGGAAVRYPDVSGPTSWQGLSWGAVTVRSDGSDCAEDDGTRRPRPAEPIPAALTAERAGVPDSTWDELLPAQDPVTSALDRLLTPTG